MTDILKMIYDIRDYIVRGSQPLNHAWYNQAMDDLHYIMDWLENIKDVEE